MTARDVGRPAPPIALDKHGDRWTPVPDWPGHWERIDEPRIRLSSTEARDRYGLRAWSETRHCPTCTCQTSGVPR